MANQRKSKGQYIYEKTRKPSHIGNTDRTTGGGFLSRGMHEKSTRESEKKKKNNQETTSLKAKKQMGKR